MKDNYDSFRRFATTLIAIADIAMRGLAPLSAIVIGVLVAAVSFSALVKSPTRNANISNNLYREIDATKTTQEAFANQLSVLNIKLSDLMSLSTNGTQAVDFAAVKSDLNDLTSRLQILENSLMDTPEKALSVPLLRQDLENLKSSFLSDGNEYIRQIDRMYDQNKWFIGLMFSMALGLIGLAISNFLQNKRKNE